MSMNPLLFDSIEKRDNYFKEHEDNLKPGTTVIVKEYGENIIYIYDNDLHPNRYFDSNEQYLLSKINILEQKIDKILFIIEKGEKNGLLE